MAQQHNRDSGSPAPGAPPLWRAVLAGCLLGATLAASWAVFGVAIYALLHALGASTALSVLVGGLLGPLAGSALVVLWWLRKYGSLRRGAGGAPTDDADAGNAR